MDEDDWCEAGVVRLVELLLFVLGDDAGHDSAVLSGAARDAGLTYSCAMD